jgi:hypothetical protein
VTTVVFLGPSLSRGEAESIYPEALYLPPARQSDVLSALSTYEPSVIGLIDGVFGQSLSVWHKEVLLALERGVHVVGAASIGALRAAELDSFGMIGVGEIYHQFASGELEDDDEVAVLHAGAEYAFRPLSEPMVNVRATLRQAAEEARLNELSYERLVAVAKGIYFADRTWITIFDAAAGEVNPGELAAARMCAKERYVDVKAADARLLLRRLAAGDISTPSNPPKTARSRGLTLAYELDRKVRHSELEVPLRNVAARASLNALEFDNANFAALNRALVQLLAEMLGLEPARAEIDAEMHRFRRERALGSDALVERWLADNDLSPAELRALLTELATCRRLHRWLLATSRGLHHTRWLLDELRLLGIYASIAEEAAQQIAVAGEFTETADLPDLLTTHQRTTGWHADAPISVWAEEAGFMNPVDLALELSAATRARARIAKLLEKLVNYDGEYSPDGGTL